MRSSNPVLTRLGEVSQQERVPTQRDGYGFTYGQSYGAPSPGGPGYPPPVIMPGSAARDRTMTLDDVVTRSVALILVTTVSAAAGWVFLTGGAWLGVAVFGSVIGGLVLGLVIAFKRITNPWLISLYAVLQGLLLGVVSRQFEARYSGIVLQAVIGTLGVFAGMALLYKARVIRATPRFARFLLGALFGVVALSLVNWVLAMFGHNLGLEYYGPNDSAGHSVVIPIVFALVCIGIGALTFILDFDAVEQGIRYGLPEKYAWYCAFGILVGLIYLYWQILRLLGYLRR